jgi:hypothetical protein
MGLLASWPNLNLEDQRLLFILILAKLVHPLSDFPQVLITLRISLLFFGELGMIMAGDLW